MYYTSLGLGWWECTMINISRFVCYISFLLTALRFFLLVSHNHFGCKGKWVHNYNLCVHFAIPYRTNVKSEANCNNNNNSNKRSIPSVLGYDFWDAKFLQDYVEELRASTTTRTTIILFLALRFLFITAWKELDGECGHIEKCNVVTRAVVGKWNDKTIHFFPSYDENEHKKVVHMHIELRPMFVNASASCSKKKLRNEWVNEKVAGIWSERRNTLYPIFCALWF